MSMFLRRAAPWLLAIWIAYVFLWYLQYKFTGHEGSVWLFTVITDWLGLKGYEKAMRVGVGACELIAATLCLIPRLRALGATATIALMSGAIFFHGLPEATPMARVFVADNHVEGFVYFHLFPAQIVVERAMYMTVNGRVW